MSQSRGEAAALLGAEMFKQVVADAHIGFGAQDAEERIAYVNPALVRMLGYDSADELVGKPTREMFAPADLSEYDASLQRTMSGEMSPHGLTLRRRDGDTVRVLVTPHEVRDEHGAVVLRAAFVVDLTQLLEAGERLEGARTRKPLLADLTPRERQMVSDLLSGKTVREIARAHAISTHTVRNHVKAVYRKLGVHSRLDLMRAVMAGPGETRHAPEE